ncbi:MAG: ATP-binding protein, partial [Pseudomonadota bacterium]
LMAHGAMRGVLVTGSARPFEFTSRYIRLLRIIASQMALALEDASLREEVERGRSRPCRQKQGDPSSWVEATLDALPAAMCIVDGRGAVVLANGAWRRALRGTGVDDSTLLKAGARYTDALALVAPAGRDVAAEAIEGLGAVLRGDRDSFHLDYARTCAPDAPGETRHYQLRASAVRGPDGRGMLIEHRDVTAPGPAEYRIRRELEDLKALGKRKDDFLSDFTHDLKTPLVPLKGFLDIVLSGRAGELNDRQRTFLSYCDNALARQVNKIDDLLEFTRIRAGEARLEPEPLDLAKVLAGSLQFLGLMARDRQVRVETDIDPRPLRVAGEARKLQRVFNNLFSNAVRYNSSGGAVLVRAVRRKGRVVITVEDTGTGIEPAEIGKLFERSYHSPQGAGIGLSVAGELARLHGGEIFVSSEPGEGSVFALNLPLIPD